MIGFIASAFALAVAQGGRVLLADPLTAPSEFATNFEGEFGSEGYRPTTPDGHLLFQLVAFPTHATLSFEVRGMQADTGHEDNDHAFLGIYDGRGIEEPAPYFGGFRDNFYRFNLHWRPDRGRIKCVVIAAADTPERRQAERAVHDDETRRDWYTEPNGAAVAWDPDRWYRFDLVFRPESIDVFRDGELVWEADLPETNPYRPVEPRIRIGSAPRNGRKYANHLPQIVYRNFRFVDDSGSGLQGERLRGFEPCAANSRTN